MVIMGQTFERHLQNLPDACAGKTTTGGAATKPSKCSLFQETVVYLGHVVTREGILTDPEKVNAVKTWPVPTSGRDVQQCLGLLGWILQKLYSEFREAPVSADRTRT